MKLFSTFLVALLGVANLAAQGLDSLNMTLMGRFDDESLPDAAYGSTPFSYAGCYGFAKDGREYALLGSSAFVHVLDVTDPANIAEKGKFAGGNTTVWREMNMYHDIAYCITDAASEGLIVLDLSQLPDTVIKVQQTSEFFSSAHTLYVDEPNGRLYVMGSSVADLVILDVATDPKHPTLLASLTLPGGYIHDMYVRDNIGYACHGYAGLYIYDFSAAATPVLKAEMVTNGYCHSAWLTDDGQHLLVADEVPTGLPLLMVDVSNYESNDISIVKQFRFPLIEGPGETVTYHNPYISGNLAFVSSYMDGLQVFDITDPLNPAPYAHYDTYLNTQYGGYNGCWGAYIELPSGRLLASDIQNGLIITAFDSTLVSEVKPVALAPEVTLMPNPATDVLRLTLPASVSSAAYAVLSPLGQVLVQGRTTNGANIPVQQLPAGTYLLRVHYENRSYTLPFVKG